jgi:heme-degrading monooxygenase HmoA
MTLEVAILNIKPSLQHNFEKDFAIASKYISSIKGYQNHSLRKCIENENKYILLVNWDNIDSHEIGFRKSEVYKKWQELLHKYYDPFPIVEHYETVFENIKNNS